MPFRPVLRMVSSVEGQVAANGTAQYRQCLARRLPRALLPGTPANGYVKSIRLGPDGSACRSLRMPTQSTGQVEIVVGTDSATVEGKVVNERQETSSNVKVALVPDAPLRRRGDLYKSTATDRNGGFPFYRVSLQATTRSLRGKKRKMAHGEIPSSCDSMNRAENRFEFIALRTETVSVVVIPPRR